MCWTYDLTSFLYRKLSLRGWDRFLEGHHSTLAPASALASLATTLNGLLLTFSMILGKYAKAASFILFPGLICQHLLVADGTLVQAFQKMLLDLSMVFKEEFRPLKPDSSLFRPLRGSVLLLFAVVNEIAGF